MKKFVSFLIVSTIIILILSIILALIKNKDEKESIPSWNQNNNEYIKAQASIGDVKKEITLDSYAYVNENYFCEYEYGTDILNVEVGDIVYKGDIISDSITSNTFGRIVNIDAQKVYISSFSNMKCDIYVNQEYVNEISIGQEVFVNYNDVTINGKIEGHNYLIEDGYLKVSVKIEENDLLMEGSNLKVNIVLKQKENVLIIPKEALIIEEDYYVYVLENEYVKKVNVVVGLIGNNYVEIKSGLKVESVVLIDQYD